MTDEWTQVANDWLRDNGWLTDNPVEPNQAGWRCGLEGRAGVARWAESLGNGEGRWYGDGYSYTFGSGYGSKE